MNLLKDRVTLSLIIILVTCFIASSQAQENATRKDTVIYRTTYRDTVIYKYDTIHIKYYVRTDTVWSSATDNDKAVAATDDRRIIFNPNSWGIGPSVGAYYSPFNGFDVNIGFGIQYYLFAVPSFRNPHLGHKKQNRKSKR